MTQFEQFLIFYKQLKDILVQIDECLDKTDYNAALTLLNNQKIVIKKIVALKANIIFTNEQKLQIKDIETALNNKKNELVKKMNDLKFDLKFELDKLNLTEKMDTIYNSPTEEESNTGSLIDLSE